MLEVVILKMNSNDTITGTYCETSLLSVLEEELLNNYNTSETVDDLIDMGCLSLETDGFHTLNNTYADSDYIYISDNLNMLEIMDYCGDYYGFFYIFDKRGYKIRRYIDLGKFKVFELNADGNDREIGMYDI